MKARQWIILSALLVLVALAIAGFILTSGTTTPIRRSRQAASQQTALVDQSPLQAARKLAPLASTPDEQVIAQDVLRIADHEVDLAFADALRNAQEHPVKLTPEMRTLAQHVDQAEAAVRADQDRVNALTKSMALASESAKEILQQKLDVSQAQLAMDQDELDDAKEDLSRAGGDQQSSIQRLLDQHEASQHAGGEVHADMSAKPPDIDYAAGHFASQLRAWIALRGKQAQLSQARQDALNAAGALVARHGQLEQHIKEEAAEKQALTQRTSGMISGQTTGQAAKATASAAITSLRHFSEDQKALSELDKRIQDEQELAENYGNWAALVQTHQGIALHGLMQSVLWILVIVLLVYLIGRIIDQYFTELAPEKVRLATLRVVVRFAVQAVGVLLILFVIFGAPSQTPTILGLAGAGLTVALKDFIVAFFGWFVLMGRNGVRVGDWVEINGVGGEVVEISLLRTVLLETGNWTDSGHPTGRRVAFVNSYAVEGHYFNFSTSGQWLWDELQILIPAGENPYPIVDGIQKLVSAETETNARLAEQEWQRATSRYRVKSFSAVPSINVRPTNQGIEIIVRYITRAHQRHDVRARLYQAIVDMMHRKQGEAAPASLPAPAAK